MALVLIYEWLEQNKVWIFLCLCLPRVTPLDDKLKGFVAGTDDYLVKPFDFNRLVMRIRALIKRSLGKFPK